MMRVSRHSRNDRVDRVMGMAENPGISLRDLFNRAVMRDDDGLASEILSQLRSQKVPRTNVASDEIDRAKLSKALADSDLGEVAHPPPAQRHRYAVIPCRSKI